ncbi:hypothetical protein PSTG_13985 [Puccinia striiformis f. sp. tritici PST-78]|uniref:Uncharacterized protein n=1 Tax=Puccinia striiformis f. sp. tritici PST-78 TaxID=1165861 RepID=A0A0L0V0R9_9BASI|nr:hypothetical protein PSTG_13985 [Puccinia striiformis f. sp. tritici PST-78]
MLSYNTDGLAHSLSKKEFPLLRQHKPDTITDLQTPTPDPVLVEGGEEWEVE